jgi:hypothetical protein
MGDLTVGAAIGNATDNLTLNATAGNIVGGGTITANILTLNAGGGIGIGTAVTADSTTYNLISAGIGPAGNITLMDVGEPGLNTNQITVSTHDTAQTVSLTAAAGNLTVGKAIGNSIDNLTLVSSLGSIASGEIVTADVLTLSAMTGIGSKIELQTFPLLIDAATLDVSNNGFGNISLSEANDVTVWRLHNGALDDSNKATGTIDLLAGGNITLASGGAGVKTQDGDIRLVAHSILAQSAISATHRGDVWLESLETGISFTDDGDITVEDGRIYVNAKTVLSLGNDTVFRTQAGRMSGQILNSPAPLMGSANLGAPLSDVQRLASILVQIQDTQGIGYGIEIDWLEGNPTGPVNVPPEDLRAQTVTSSIDYVPDSTFRHLYEKFPDASRPNDNIPVQLSITKFANGTIELKSGGESVLNQGKFMSTITLGISTTLGVSPPLVPISQQGPGPVPRSSSTITQPPPVLVNLPIQQRSLTLNSGLDISNSIGTSAEALERYYVLRVVTFGEAGTVELDEYRLKDLEDPDSEEGFELSQLPELFKRLPDDRYRIYLIDGKTEKLMLDVIIRDGQPVEVQDEDPVDKQGFIDPVAPAQALMLEADTLSVDELVVPVIGTNRGPAEAEHEETDSEGEVVRVLPAGTTEGQHSAAERLGTLPAVSSGGVLIGAGMFKSWYKPRRKMSTEAEIERPGKRPNRTA